MSKVSHRAYRDRGADRTRRLISAPSLADNRSVAQEDRALLESNPSACAMAGQCLERFLDQKRSRPPILEKGVLACPKAINSPEREAARSASEQMPRGFRRIAYPSSDWRPSAL